MGIKILFQATRPLMQQTSKALGIGLGAYLMLLGASGWGFEPQISGKIELRGNYDTNLFLTAEDYDFELRRHPGDKTEESEMYGRLSTDLRLTLPVCEGFEPQIRYRLDGERYDDYSGENNDRHRLQVMPVFHLSENIDLKLEYALDAENRRGKAEYLRPDYIEHLVGAGLDWKVYEGGELSLRYAYEDRNYDSLDDTPFDDYNGHEAEIEFQHKFNRQWRLGTSLLYRLRYYDEDTLDEFGNTIVGKDRDDERLEAGLALTCLPNPKVLLRAGYLYRNHWATGEFYDYEMHRLYGIWVQQFPWKVSWQTYFHYEWRSYDDQKAQDSLIDPISLTWIQGPYDETRSDTQQFLLLNLSKELFERVSCGAEFQYLNCDSEDDSSEYEAERYALYVQYRF